MLFQFVMMGLVLLCVWAFPGRSVPPLVRAAGFGCMLLGAALGAFGAIALGRRLTPMPGPVPHGGLVTHGIYACMRHPLYTAVGLFFLGFALQSGSGPGLVAALLLGVFLDAKSRYEERLLRARFPDYEAYARKVRRFLPGVY